MKVITQKISTLNHIYSSWVNIGKPASLSGREQYLKADGHTVYCSGTFLVEPSSIDRKIVDRAIEGAPLLVWATTDGQGTVCLAVGVNTHSEPYCLAGGGLQVIQHVYDYPLGYFEPIEMAKRSLGVVDCPACAGEADSHSQFCQMADQEPIIDDSVRCCPDCETPNQFGELCSRCQDDRRAESMPD